MEIRLISVGKIRDKVYKEKIDEYLKWIRPYARVTFTEGLEERLSPKAGSREQEEARRREGQRVWPLWRAGRHCRVHRPALDHGADDAAPLPVLVSRLQAAGLAASPERIHATSAAPRPPSQ